MKWLIFTYLLFQIDNKTKRWAEDKLKKGAEPSPVGGGKFFLHRVSNKGMAGGVLSEKSDKILIASTIAGALIGLNFLFVIPRKGRILAKTASAFLAAGAAGNLYDRWIKGSVTDFIRLGKGTGKLSSAVFNIADVFILAGGLLLIPVRLFDIKS